MKKKAPEPAPDKELVKLANRLRQLRKDKGHSSYEKFANEINIGRSQYGRYEKAQTDPQYLTLLKIVNALGMTMEEFFSEGFDD